MPVTHGKNQRGYPTRLGGTGRWANLPEGIQLITFAIERDEDLRFKKWIWIPVTKGTTIAQIASRRGHPEDARLIAKTNRVRNIDWVLWTARPKAKQKKAFKKWKKRRKVRRLKVPGELKSSLSFHVLPGDTPPKVVGGYAKFENVDRPERVGLVSFNGYDPLEMTIPVRFEAKGTGHPAELENEIELLERMAGRGPFDGAGVGPPPIIRITTTDSEGNVVPLIPRNLQYASQRKTGPLWRVVGIDWDDGALRNRYGNRYRQLATVTVRQHIRVRLATRSVTKRNRTKRKKKGKGGRRARRRR